VPFTVRPAITHPAKKAFDGEFMVAGIPCIGINGGPAFKHNEAFSFQIATDDERPGERVGWCQITPRVLIEALAVGGDEQSALSMR
jgi:hypothetical protein